jgi:carboxymethylenebutenolidase
MTSRLSFTVGISVALLAGIASGALFAQHRSIPPLDAVTTHGEWVKFANARGDSVRAYVAYPERSDKAPAVIVVHEIFGLTDWEPTIGDRFAKDGYVAIVPDLLSSRFGDTASKRPDARSLVGQLAPDGVVTDLNAAYAYVNAQPAVRKDDTGIIGFCWGGGTVWQYVTANPDLKAAVACYGPPPTTDAMAKIHASVYAVYAENDARITATRDSVTAQMARLGKSFQNSVYQGTGHGFLKPGRNGYGTPEYDRAWKDIDAFLARTLHVR